MKHLSPIQSAALIALLDSRTDAAAVLVRILRETGMRCDELAKLRIRDVQLETGAVTVHASKGSNDRKGFLSAKTLELLAALIHDSVLLSDMSQSVMTLLSYAYAASATDETVRHAAKQYLRCEWRRMRLMIDARDVGLHGLRHTAAIAMLRGTGDLRQTQAVLGHKDINNTTRYLEAVDQEAAARALLRLVG